MQDLNKIIRTYSCKEVLLVSDFNISVVAKEILNTVKLLQEWNLCSWKLLDRMIFNEFKLDICNNNFHCIIWENWMKFISDLDLINIEIRWAYPSDLCITESDINYLESLIVS